MLNHHPWACPQWHRISHVYQESELTYPDVFSVKLLLVVFLNNAPRRNSFHLTHSACNTEADFPISAASNTSIVRSRRRWRKRGVGPKKHRMANGSVSIEKFTSTKVSAKAINAITSGGESIAKSFDVQCKLFIFCVLWRFQCHFVNFLKSPLFFLTQFY